MVLFTCVVTSFATAGVLAAQANLIIFYDGLAADENRTHRLTTTLRGYMIVLKKTLSYVLCRWAPLVWKVSSLSHM